MPRTTALSAPSTKPEPFDLDRLERTLVRSEAFAWGLIVGLPALGVAASLLSGLPLFAALMAGCFLLAVASVCRKALATFTGRTLRLLVTARLVAIFVLAALLFCASGSAWAGLVSAVLLWLVADRLLGRRALYDLWKDVRESKRPLSAAPKEEEPSCS